MSRLNLVDVFSAFPCSVISCIAFAVGVHNFSVFSKSLLHYLGGTLDPPIHHDNLLNPSKRPWTTTRVLFKTPSKAITGTDNLDLIAHAVTRIVYEKIHSAVHQVEDGVLPEVGKGLLAALCAGLR